MRVDRFVWLLTTLSAACANGARSTREPQPNEVHVAASPSAPGSLCRFVDVEGYVTHVPARGGEQCSTDGYSASAPAPKSVSRQPQRHEAEPEEGFDRALDSRTCEEQYTRCNEENRR